MADQLKRDIKGRISSGIIAGKSIHDISRDIGEVITDKDSFRHAGRTVFKSAQHRVEMIAAPRRFVPTQVRLNLKFYEEAGVKKVKWLTADDERVCSACGPLYGKVFDLAGFDGPPRHPRRKPFAKLLKVSNGCLAETSTVSSSTSNYCL